MIFHDRRLFHGLKIFHDKKISHDHEERNESVAVMFVEVYPHLILWYFAVYALHGQKMKQWVDIGEESTWGMNG
jgi:hypothetical protein